MKAVTKERCKWLEERPWWTLYHTTLQEHLNTLCPGSHLVAHDDPTSQIPELLTMQPLIVTSIFDVSDKYGMHGGDCHNNVQKLFKAGIIEKMMIGYALSEDGLWRFHSWGMKGSILIETTEKRLTYIGIDYRQLEYNCNV